MLIINADDWGGWPEATDAAFSCLGKQRITSVSAMVFMEDSLRASRLACDTGMDVGLHVNFTQSFTARNVPPGLREAQDRLRRYLKSCRFAQCVYHPLLKRDFLQVYQAQAEEFGRLYCREPSHVDGHQHMHLCLNMMFDPILPKGQVVRRNFSFWPGQKGPVNRFYRAMVDRNLARHYRLVDYFFSLEQCLNNGSLPRVVGLAGHARLELMTHPEKPVERAWLEGEDFPKWFGDVTLCDFSAFRNA